MTHPNFLQELSEKISALIPLGIKDMKHDVEKQIKVILQSALSHLDFVNREEFDRQTATLSRLRSKLTTLEEKISELENSQKK